MKKMILLLTALLCLTLLLGACGGKTKAPACEHQWEEGSCYMPKNCILCGVTEGEPVHDYVVEDAESVVPNCLEGGSYQYYCAICDDPFMESIPASGHTVSDGYCIECGEAVTE